MTGYSDKRHSSSYQAMFLKKMTGCVHRYPKNSRHRYVDNFHARTYLGIDVIFASVVIDD